MSTPRDAIYEANTLFSEFTSMSSVDKVSEDQKEHMAGNDSRNGGSVAGDNMRVAAAATRLAGSLQKKVAEATYLVALNHERYRPIMRFFYQQHMGHQYALSLEDVVANVRATIDSSYTEEQCEQDLGQLCEWGNLAAEQDRSRARTVEEFLRRRLRYTITSYGVAFERLLSELEEGAGAGGSLDPSLLELLAERLDRLIDAVAAVHGDPRHGMETDSGDDAATTDGSSGLSIDEHALREVYNLWNRAFEAFDKIGQQASDYLGELHRGQHEDLSDIEVFLAYKDVLLQYLNSFVTGLFDIGDRIGELLRRMASQDWPERLLAPLVAYETRFVPTASGTLPAPETVRSRRLNEWRALERWFRPRGGLETLRRRTTAVIERVVRQSQRVMDRRSGLSRRRDLEEMAICFARVDALEQAHRLAGAAWGCAIPRHITGSAEVFSLEAVGSVWEQTPQELPLTAVRSGGGGFRRRSEPVQTHDERQRQTLTGEMERRKQEKVVWDALFADGDLDLGDLALTRVELRARLLVVVAQCLSSPDHSTAAPDGSTILLLPPEEGGSSTGLLKAPDGSLAMPRLRLRRRTSLGKMSSENPALDSKAAGAAREVAAASRSDGSEPNAPAEGARRPRGLADRGGAARF